MSLATRCTACGTVFRVVQDQLRVSGGWVRCGRCAEVFNAIESLVDLEPDRDTTTGAASAHGERVMQELADFSRPTPPQADAVLPAATARVAETDLAPSAWPDAPSDVPADAQDAATEGDFGPEPDRPATPAADSAVPVSAPAPIGEPTMSWKTATPNFLRQAERAARWRHPRMRVGLTLAALLAATALTLQIMLAWHDLIPARWPTVAPVVRWLCEQQGCTVAAPRRIDQLAVESSGLLRAGPAGSYRLAVVLRNRDPALPLRMPALDLSLTDAQGALLARRVFEPAQLGIVVDRLAPGGELVIHAALRAVGTPVVGYTIELFYP